ncbi:DNA ligase D, partial [Enterovirga sp.]|uniref:DNA ligase D n=1 Tax=Enterovirga sp. TaxID=2026350 RepID=UPI0026340156
MATRVPRRAKVGREVRRSDPGALPDFVPPQLTALGEEAPEGPDWAHELKWDGYRMHARIDRGEVRLLTRTGLDWTERYPAVAEALRALPVTDAYLDGELCALGETGLTSFSAMQAATDSRATGGLVLILFDLLFLDGEELTALPLRDRKARLEAVLAGAPPALQFSEHHLGSGALFHRHACKLGVEGVVSKRLDCPYRPGDRGIWRKVKCLNREEFVVVGWTDPDGSRPHLGALLLAYHAPDGRLVYAGRAGTGLNAEQLGDLRARLGPLATSRMPVDVPPPPGSRFGSRLVLSRVHWVRPEMVVEVTYLTWTEDNLLRQVVFAGVREDKPARDVVRPIPHPKVQAPAPVRRAAPKEPAARSRPAMIGGVPAENVLQHLPDACVPSREALAAYWTRVHRTALEHLGRRPLKLVRHLRGTTFYHMGPLPPVPEAVHQLTIEKREGGLGTRLWVDSLEGLLGLVEIGAVELHPWNATVDDIERPDRLVFDLDPGEGVAWPLVAATALRLRDRLARQGLASWPKLTGGKGLHLMVPIAPGPTHDELHEQARDIAEGFAATRPDLVITTAELARRPGRLFLDYLRNGRGTTAVGTYSPRARPNVPVAMPVTWADVERGIRPDAFTIDTAPAAPPR